MPKKDKTTGALRVARYAQDTLSDVAKGTKFGDANFPRAKPTHTMTVQDAQLRARGAQKKLNAAVGIGKIYGFKKGK